MPNNLINETLLIINYNLFASKIEENRNKR